MVVHPVLDACLDLRAAHRIDPEQVAKVDVTIGPLALLRCGNPAPRNSLESKLSLAHSAAIALLDGAAGVPQYSDARVNDPRVVALRDKVVVSSDATIGNEQARVRITLANGKALELFVEQARGSQQRPLSDADLDAKFRSLAAAELAPRAIEQLLGQCRSLAELPDAGAIARAGAAPDA